MPLGHHVLMEARRRNQKELIVARENRPQDDASARRNERASRCEAGSFEALTDYERSFGRLAVCLDGLLGIAVQYDW